MARAARRRRVSGAVRLVRRHTPRTKPAPYVRRERKGTKRRFHISASVTPNTSGLRQPAQGESDATQARIRPPIATHLMSSTTYCVEYAKSNRAACKTCSIKIDKGAVRIGTTFPGPGDYDITAWRHLACQKRIAALAGPSELAGFADLKASDKDLVFSWFEGDMTSVMSAKRKADEASAAAATSSGSAFSTPKKSKKMSTPPSTPPSQKTTPTSFASASGAPMTVTDEIARRDEASAIFGGMTIPTLKNILRANNALLSGTKPDLVERCVDRKLYGNLPKCPACGIGRLKVVYPRALGHGGQGVFVPRRLRRR